MVRPPSLLFVETDGGSRNVTNRRSDHRHFVSPRSEQARKLVVTCAARLIEGCECLVNDKDVHNGQ